MTLESDAIPRTDKSRTELNREDWTKIYADLQALEGFATAVRENIYAIHDSTQSTSYTGLGGSFIYEGSDTVQIPTSIELVAFRDASANAMDARIFDLTNNQVIAEVTGMSATVQTIHDFGTISNVPTEKAIWEVQAKRVGGSASDCSIDSISFLVSPVAEMAQYRSVHKMLQSSLLSTGTSDDERLETITMVDNDWVDGTTTCTFEVDLHTDNGAREAFAILREEGEATDLATLSTFSTTPERLSVTFNYPSSPQAAKTFTVTLKNGHNAGNTIITEADIIADQAGRITKRATTIPLGSHFVEAGATPASYPTNQQKHWLWDASKWDGTVEIYLVTVFRAQTGGDVATAYLTNRTTGLPIASMATTSATIGRMQSVDLSGFIADLTEYEVELSLVSGGSAAEAYSSHILIIQTDTPKKSQPVHVIGWDNDNDVTDLGSGAWNSTNGVDGNATGQRALIDLSKYSAATSITAYLEATGFYTTSLTGAQVDAINDGANESGTAGSSDQTLAITNTVPTRERSAAFVPVDGNRYYGRVDSDNPGITDIGNAWILIEVDDTV